MVFDSSRRGTITEYIVSGIMRSGRRALFRCFGGRQQGNKKNTTLGCFFCGLYFACEFSSVVEDDEKTKTHNQKLKTITKKGNECD